MTNAKPERVEISAMTEKKAHDLSAGGRPIVGYILRNGDDGVALIEDSRVIWIGRKEWDAIMRRTPAEPQWQPIETAPRDGTRVLLWVPTTVTNCGCHAIGEWQDWHDDEDGWFGDDGEYLGEPTFWKPLDAPPVTK